MIAQRERAAASGGLLQPAFVGVTGTRLPTEEDLCEYLLARPGRYFLKPRWGANGVAVARLTSDGVQLRAESDCPETALFLDEFPASPSQYGRDLIRGLAEQRGRFLNLATAGIPEPLLDQSILEQEIPESRVDDAIFEPRFVFQRESESRFVLLGGICKIVHSSVGAVLARDYVEMLLHGALCQFLKGHAMRPDSCEGNLLALAERAAGGIVADLDAGTHQFGLDGRLVWNAATRQVDFWFLEFQIGIARIENLPLTGYRTPAELREQFG